VQAQFAGISEARDESQAEQVEEREHVLGGAVGVGGVLAYGERGVQDPLERVDGLALGDRDDLGAVLAVLIRRPVEDGERAAAVAELARERVGGGGATARRRALPVA
jgi:hypothetical protein